jgi:malonate transporter and related proteins
LLQILSQTGPIYLIILGGFLAVRFGLFAQADLRILGRFAFLFCITSLLFDALSSRRIAEVLDAAYLFAYGAGSLGVLLGGYVWARWRNGASQALASLQGMGMSSSNSGYIGYPVALLFFGPVAGVALALTLLIENFLILPLAMAMADARPGQDRRAALREAAVGLTKNPLVIAIVLGTLFSLLGWRLPEFASRAVKLMAGASAPVGLFMVGGSLVGLTLTGVRGDLARVALGKLLLHPLAVGGLMWFWAPANPALVAPGVLLAAMPMLGIYTVLAQKHGESAFSAAALLVTTVASFFTISALMWALRHGLNL